MTSLPAPVLVFDSGVGGLSILQAIAEALPNLPLVFACDNAAFPYGTKPEAELIERVDTVLHALIDRIRPQLVVIACNTASTVALPHVRKHFDLPFVGVVPAIKPAAQLSRRKRIGILATTATIKRPYLDDLVREFAGDCQVIRVGSSELVQEAEAALRGQPPEPARLRVMLAPFFADPATAVDTIVLGCTHFPLLRKELAAAAPEPINWVDSGDAIARRVASLVAETDLVRASHTTNTASTDKPALTAWMTADTPSARALWPALAARGFTDLQFLAV